MTEGNLLTQVFVPPRDKADCDRLEQRPNIVCFVYKELEVKTYVVGDNL
jgi:hypothetical protein